MQNGLGNGARLERINFLADRSPAALTASYGMMVNYVYELERIEANHEAFVSSGRVSAAGAVKRLLTFHNLSAPTHAFNSGPSQTICVSPAT